MDATTYNNHVAILFDELKCALGCTEPIAVALAAALAREALAQASILPPFAAQNETYCQKLAQSVDHLTIWCSGNIIKNVKSVTVPHSGGARGIAAAVALGLFGGDANASLEVLETAGDLARAQAAAFETAEKIQVELAEDVPNLYVKVALEACDSDGLHHLAQVCLEERHTNLTLCMVDDKPVSPLSLNNPSSSSQSDASHAKNKNAAPQASMPAEREKLTLKSIWEFIHSCNINDIQEPIERQITYNQRISSEGLTNSWGANIGKTLLASRPHDLACRARAAAAAGSDARMSGCPLPVVICCGSGNQGITCSAPVYTYAQELMANDEETIRAVALSDLVAVHIKHYIGELSAFCGAVCAAAGAGAGISYLRGATFEQYQAAIVNTLVNVGGIVCDGAKASCAAKISSAVDAAILGCDMAFANQNFAAGEGLVAGDAEQTIRSMGYIGRVGMATTDKEILNIMIGKTTPGELC